MYAKLNIFFIHRIICNKFILVLMNSQQCFAKCISFQAAAADGTRHSSIFFHQHTCTRSPVRRTFYIHNSCKSCFMSLLLGQFKGVDDFVDLFQHPSL